MLLSIMEQEWFQIILGALSLGVAGLITWAFTMFQAWLNSKIKNEKLRAVLDAALDVIQKSVLAIQQTFVEQLKKDGKFDKEAQKEALKKSVNLALANLSDELPYLPNDVSHFSFFHNHFRDKKLSQFA